MRSRASWLTSRSAGRALVAESGPGGEGQGQLPLQKPGITSGKREEGCGGNWSPEQLRRQFWERQHKITQLTILADRDTVPWELLYPLIPGHDAGFLVEQFPVTRMVFRRRPPAW